MAQGLQIRALRPGHRLIACGPVLGVFKRIPGGVGRAWGCLSVFHCDVLLCLRALVCQKSRVRASAHEDGRLLVASYEVSEGRGR